MRDAPPLLAVAHGSRDPRAAATVEALLAEVRRRRPLLRVATAYLDHGPPAVGQALDAIASDATGGGGDEVVVLPLLLTAAYHSKIDLPGALRDLHSRHPRLRVRYGETLGPHVALVMAMERRLAEAGVRPGDSETAVVLAAAGSSDPSAGAVVSRMARAWARQRWWAVSPAYASAARPTPAEAVVLLRDAGAPRVAVASYFLAPGYFADKVRDEALAAGAAAVSPVLGAAPDVADVVVERYEKALHGEREVAAAG